MTGRRLGEHGSSMRIVGGCLGAVALLTMPGCTGSTSPNDDKEPPTTVTQAYRLLGQRLEALDRRGITVDSAYVNGGSIYISVDRHVRDREAALEVLTDLLGADHIKVTFDGRPAIAQAG